MLLLEPADESAPIFGEPSPEAPSDAHDPLWCIVHRVWACSCRFCVGIEAP